VAPDARLLVGVLAALHALTVCAALVARADLSDTPRAWVRPYESLAGVYQNWNMFAPNPPFSDTWMEVVAVGSGGKETALEPIHGARSDVAAEWRYQRAGKIERNLLSAKRKKWLKVYALGRCGEVPGTRRVRVMRVSRRTPKPADRLNGETYLLQRDRAVQVKCP